MRTEKEIKGKILMLTAVNWPEGAAAGAVLGDYLTALPEVSYGDVLNDLAAVVKEAYELLDSDPGAAQYKIIEAITVVWMLGDDRFIRQLEQVEWDAPAVAKLATIRDRYEIITDPKGE